MLTLIFLIAFIGSCSGFYLPGVAPYDFKRGETVDLKVNKLRYAFLHITLKLYKLLDSPHSLLYVYSPSSVHTLLPYDYYSLKFCKPKGGVKPYSENLGEFLRGDRIENSAYEVRLLSQRFFRNDLLRSNFIFLYTYLQINMLEEEYCKVLCQVELKTKDVTDFKTAIQRQYRHNWIIDNLPAASILDTDQYVSTQYVGYPVGKSNLYSI